MNTQNNASWDICGQQKYNSASHKMKRVIGELDLLRSYMRTEFPVGLYAVLDFYQCDSGAIYDQLVEAFLAAGTSDPTPGLTIWEISSEFEAQLMQDFNKSGVDIWVFLDGELVNETR